MFSSPLLNLDSPQFETSDFRKTAPSDFANQKGVPFLENIGYLLLLSAVVDSLRLAGMIAPHIESACSPYASSRASTGQTGRWIGMKGAILELTPFRMARLMLFAFGGSFLVSQGRDLANRGIEVIRANR